MQFIDRNIKLPSTTTEIKARFEHDEWQMIDAERSVLTAILSELQPLCAIEVGTYKAGSLGVMSKFCKKVFTLDIDPTYRDMYRKSFPNVQFIVGDSKKTLPFLLEKIRSDGEKLSFVLIDGVHSEKCVRCDIENVLQYTPIEPLYIIMHDSFHPKCRKGILEANWNANPYVHVVEVDLTAGTISPKEVTGYYRHMYNGFALAVMLPEKREGDVFIHQNGSLMFKIAYCCSIYPYQHIEKPIYLISLMKKKVLSILKN
jgi:hypothetical protein